MSHLWNPLVSTLTPYVPGEQTLDPGVIKLNTNENPYGPSPQVIAAIRQAATDDLRLYPDPDCRAVKSAVAEKFGLSPQEVFVGNGSDEVLALAFLGLLKPDKPVLLPDVTYSFYPVYCRLHRIGWQTVPVDEEFRIQVEDYLRDNGGIVLANPNAPTGIALERDKIEHLLASNQHSVVILDEAYVDFGAETCVPLIRKWPNLLVVQTLSKSWGLAGLRVGFAMGHPVLIEALERVKASFNSYPLDRMAIAGAVAALKDTQYVEGVCARIISARDWLETRMTALGFKVMPSKTNFLFVRHPAYHAEWLYAHLRQQRILVRHFPHERTGAYLRITVGTREQCQTLVDVLERLTSVPETVSGQAAKADM